MGRWNLDPVVIGALALGTLAWIVHRRAGGGAREDLLWGAALVALALLFVSPFCALGSALFSARVAHHAALVVLVAPLLAFALPRPHAGLEPPLGPAVAVHGLVFWLWHAPPAYGWALSTDAGYWLMQASLLGSALAFWLAVRRAPAPAAAAGLLAVMVLTGLLGALITFAGQPLYAPHLTTTAAWGLSALEDQQLAGLIMWVPMAGAYLAAALAVVGGWLGRQAKPGETAR